MLLILTRTARHRNIPKDLTRYLSDKSNKDNKRKKVREQLKSIF